MAQIKTIILLLALIIVLVSFDVALAAGKGNENNGQGSNSNNNKDNKNGNNKKDDNDFSDLPTLKITKQERGRCKVSENKCDGKNLTCPLECPHKKPKHNKKQKGCYFDCRNNCEAICKWRKPKCEGYGSLCYDPRFVGGDGVMFYFHGTKGGNFAIVSDKNLQINAHFIGTRPKGRTRDFTWVQALAVMFDSHKLVIAAKRVTYWDDNIDSLIIRWDGEELHIPISGDAEWRPKNSKKRGVVIERTEVVNSVRVQINGLVQMDVSVKPIGKRDNEVHKYMLPDNDAFAHLETQFKFKDLSDQVEGVLGKTYRPNYVSPVKVGVPMPMMGGEDRYHVQSFLSSKCKVCKFNKKHDDDDNDHDDNDNSDHDDGDNDDNKKHKDKDEGKDETIYEEEDNNEEKKKMKEQDMKIVQVSLSNF